MQNLETAGLGNSLVAQVLRAGLVGRSFDIGNIDDPNFVDNFFNAKIEEVISNAPRVELKITHHLTQTGYDIDSTAITPDPAAAPGTTVTWHSELIADLNPDGIFEIPGIVTAMLPGELREISEGTDLKVTYRDMSKQEITQTLMLAPVAVAASHIIDLDPLSRTTEAGDTTTFDVILTNPTAIEQTYTLSTLGLEDQSTTLPSSVAVPAGATITTPLTVDTSETARGDCVFTVQAQPTGGGTDTVQGTLSLTGEDVIPITDPPDPIGLAALAVDLQLTPNTATAGQGTAATFTARITNTGDKTATFDLTGAFPPGFAAKLSETQVTLLPGLGSFRDVQITLTPPSDTPASSHPFTVKATAASDSSVSDQAGAAVNVLDLGVGVALSPQSGTPNSTFQLTVTNTGQRNDTFDLALAGPVALFATLGVNSVTLTANASQTFPVNVGAIDEALPGGLVLTAVATSQTDNAVQSSASAGVSIAARQGVNAEFDPASTQLEAPGPADTGLRVRNTGNIEDAYEAVITAASGPLAAELIGPNQQPTQAIEIFRLPAQATGLIPLDAELLQAGSGQVTVTVTSLNAAAINDDASYSVSSQQQDPRRLSRR